MRVLLQLRFTYDFQKYWITQISLLAMIKFIKVMRITERYTEEDVLNIFISDNKRLVDMLIKNGDLKSTEESKILYSEIIPSINNYPGKAIFFVGGRNDVHTNWDFCKRLSDFLGIVIVTFQYSGYYKSGCYYHNDKSKMTEESYLQSIKEIYKIVNEKYDTYIIAYSLGCYGAYLFNERDRIFLISPFYSLQKTIRDSISIKNFNLGNLIKEKHTKELIIHGYYGDLINPIADLIGPFEQPNVKIIKHSGNHISGLSNLLFGDIKNYVDSFGFNN